MSSAFIGLAWLPPPPDDFRQRCLAVTKAEQGVGRAIIQLASHALSDSQLRQLAKTISGLRARGADLAPMTPFRLGILGNGTLDLLLPALVGSAARFGIALECFAPDYEQVLLPATTAGSALHEARPDAGPGGARLPRPALAAWLGRRRRCGPGGSHERRGFPRENPPGRPNPQQRALHSADAGTSGRESVRQSGPGDPGHAAPHDRLAEPADHRLPPGLAGRPARCRRPRRDRRARRTGTHRPSGTWPSFRFARSFIPLYADHVAPRGRRAARQEPQAAWSSTSTIRCGAELSAMTGWTASRLRKATPPARPILAVQRTGAGSARSAALCWPYRRRTTTRWRVSAFDQHPEMLLKRGTHRCVSGQLERQGHQHQGHRRGAVARPRLRWCFWTTTRSSAGWCAELLPQVAVPELPDDPALYARTLAAAGYFEAVTFRAEDLQHAPASTRTTRERAILQKQAGDVGRLPGSLDMTITFQPFDVDRARAHRATDQQIQSVQSDHAALHRGRCCCGRA